ncbi:MAG: DUF5611 family protein [Methanolobus sp.]|uniref:DUF5611 family protein n=1 Tax=Methanolobus sp. TaxID=1874737 RepID=UPI00272FEA07|nr:DUF5611 family protein [Methanolobus sp.]MDP2216188.1 DUF5611 family protein [Methanolobus sp.]
MQEYKLKRGFAPDIDRLEECMKEIFPSEVRRDGRKLVTSYGILSTLTVWVEGKNMAVETVSDTTLKDDNLILDSNKRFRDFLLKATGYSAKERLKQAKKSVSE